MKAALAKMPQALVERIAQPRHQARRHLRLRRLRAQGHAGFDDPRTSVGTPHPIVIQHPMSGDAALYLGRRRNAYIMGLELAESERLLDEIWSYVETAVYRHKWALGDLVLWDNRTTMHRRDAFDPKARRVMHRTQIKGSAAPKRAARRLGLLQRVERLRDQRGARVERALRAGDSRRPWPRASTSANRSPSAMRAELAAGSLQRMRGAHRAGVVAARDLVGERRAEARQAAFQLADEAGQHVVASGGLLDLADLVDQLAIEQRGSESRSRRLW